MDMSEQTTTDVTGVPEHQGIESLLGGAHAHIAAGTPLSACPVLSSAGLDSVDPELLMAVFSKFFGSDSEEADEELFSPAGHPQPE
jgi:hypothetical protein